GRRKALLIGISYNGQRGELRGSAEDVLNMSKYLVDYLGYMREDVVILTEIQQRPTSQPTKQNILRALHWLVKDACPTDCLFFHYSGYVGQTGSTYDEQGINGSLFPTDFRQVGNIKDDEIHRILIGSLPTGVRLISIIDSHHSEKALGVPYTFLGAGYPGGR
ncbi:peptidase C14, caspase domain-containing protein, partial [Diaporthe sp. PMI_573]